MCGRGEVRERERERVRELDEGEKERVGGSEKERD